jgi:predicted enzyme related to lactoylglutathione lyase
MSERTEYPPGVPCWVDTLQPDPKAALDFYTAVFGWEIAGPGPMPGDGRYGVARIRQRDVAGIGSSPAPDVPTVWNTYIRVADADAAVTRAQQAGASVIAGACDVLPAGRVAVLVDPTGAPFCLWEARAREGAQIVNESGAWSMSVLNTRDPERAAAFYGTVFGWQTQPFDGTPVTLFRLPGYVGGEPQQPVPRDVVAVMLPLGTGPVPPHWSVDFWIADADAAAARAAERGATIVVPAQDTPMFRTAVIKDPQGAAFSITQLMHAPPHGAAPAA